MVIIRSATVAQTPSIQLQPFVTGLSQPVFITHAGDGSGRLFIVEQTGLIKVLQPGSSTPTDFLNLTSKRVFGGEQGVLGLAFHPQYNSNRRFFVNYTRAGDGATVIAEYLTSPSNPNIALTDEKIIIVIPQPFANHNGGMLFFGHDGYLYIGMGDGGSANDPGNRAQNINELLGKILRLDIDQTTPSTNYVSPPTNPFFGSVPGRDEIFATGMRNPWRLSVDRMTGQIYAGDVGQGQREEVDIITRGANYGWRVYEGTRCTSIDPTLCNPANYVAPITEYSHTGGRCSITGGYVYRGTRSTLPFGGYIFADYCSGELFLLNNGTQSVIMDTASNISSFGEDESGELFVVALGGTIYRIINAQANIVTSVSAANYRGGTLAADSIVAAFGSQLATTTVSGGLPLPLVLGGTQVSVRDATGISRLAPLFYVSPGQVNYAMPPGTATGPVAVVITSGAGAMSSGTFSVQAVSPGLFSANSSGSGVAAGYITLVRGPAIVGTQDIARFDPQSGGYVPQPIPMSSTSDEMILTLFGTGFRFFSSLSAVGVTIGGIPQQVEFAGPQGTFVALDQLNVRLSRSLAGRGTVDVVLTVDGIASNVLTLTIN